MAAREAAPSQWSTPWLGNRRGALIDWLTQRWVQWTGRRIDLDEHPWIDGPCGPTRGIGPDFFDRHAADHGLHPSAGPDTGLMPDFSALSGPGFDAERVRPEVHHFYEHTAAYELDVWSAWHGLFRPFGAALAALFSRRLQQLNVPLSPLDTARGMSNSVTRYEPADGGAGWSGWVRANRHSQSIVYVGAYSIADVPGCPDPCVKVVFPLPNGNATVLLRPSVGEGGSLVLTSSGRGFGDPGFFFLVRGRGTGAWVRAVRSFKEQLVVYVDDDGVLRTDHDFRIWGVRFLRLHYRLRPRAAS